MRIALSSEHIGQILRSIDFTSTAAGAMSAATFAATFGLTIANATTSLSLMLDPNTLKTNVGANSARFNNEVGTVELLIEEAKSNGVVTGGGNPRAFPSGWGDHGSTQTAGFANGPDFGNGGGASTACRVQTTSGTLQESGSNAWITGLPMGVSFWHKSNTGLAQSPSFRWSQASGTYFSYSSGASWQRYAQALNITNAAQMMPVSNKLNGLPALDLLVDVMQMELGYPSSFMPGGSRTAGDSLTDSLSNWTDSGQLNLSFTFRPQAAPTYYTSNPRLFTIKNIGGSVVSYAEIGASTSTLSLNLNGLTVTGNGVLWAAGDVVDVFVSLGNGVASIAYRRNGGPCTSLLFTSLAGAVSGNTISFLSNYGTQVLGNGLRNLTAYGANSQGPSWYDGGKLPPTKFVFSGQPLGRMSASAFAAAFPYFTFSRASFAGVQTSLSTYDLSMAVDEPGFGSYDGVNEGLSLLETRTQTWGDPLTLTNNGSTAAVTPPSGEGNFAAGPDGVVNASRVTSSGAGQYCGFIAAGASPLVTSVWTKSNTGSPQSLWKFFDFASFSGPYTVGTAWGIQWTNGCVSPHDVMPVVSTATGGNILAVYAQVEAGNYYTDPIIGTNGTRAASELGFVALNTWINAAGQLRLELLLSPTGGSEQPTYAKIRFFDCAVSGDYGELDVASGIVTFSVSGVLKSLPNAIGWTNRRLPLKVFIECGGSLPSRIFTQEGTNPPIWSGDVTGLGPMAATGNAAILSSRTPDKNLSGMLSEIATYAAGTWPSWIPTPFTSPTTNTNNVIFVGDSIMAGTVATSPVTILSQLFGGNGAGHKYTFVNTAFAGQTLANMAANVSSEVGANLVAGKRNQVVLMGGVNDLGSSGSTIFSNWTAWQSAVAALNVGGVTVDDILMFTITPRGSTRTSNSFETNRQAFLALVNAWTIPANTYVMRQDADWILDQNNVGGSGSPAQGWTPPDFNWYVNDGNFLHPNTAGASRLAAYPWKQLLALP